MYGTRFIGHRGNNQYLGYVDRSISVIKKLMIPFDRDHRVLLGTRVGDLEQVPKRSGEGCILRGRGLIGYTVGILGFLSR